jgi:hypothetical protein
MEMKRKPEKHMTIKVRKQCTSSNELIFVVVVVDCDGSSLSLISSFS